MTKKIWLIGGGTGGHIYPLRNLADELKHTSDLTLVLADQALDKQIAHDNFSDLQTHFLRTGKIRRYFSFKNFGDLFLIIKSIFKARHLLKKYQPDVLFFKGGFVCFPIILAAKSLRLKTKLFSHESDISSGRFGRWLAKQCHDSFKNFENKPLYFSPPFMGGAGGGIQKENQKLLIFGGSQGAAFINQTFLDNADELLEKYHVTLLTGTSKKINFSHTNFTQHETLPSDQLAQKIHASDLIISRGGANSLFEILSAQKPSIIIPLPSVARNHQYDNAKYFADQNLCMLLEQNQHTSKKMPALIKETLANKNLQQNLQTASIQNAAPEIAQILLST